MWPATPRSTLSFYSPNTVELQSRDQVDQMELGAYPRLWPFSFATHPRQRAYPFQDREHRHRSSWLHLSSCPVLPSIPEPQLQGRTPFFLSRDSVTALAELLGTLPCDLYSFGIDLTWAIGNEETADRIYRKDGIRWTVCSDADAPEAGNLVCLLHATE